MTYGFTYQGSKSRFAEEIINILPAAKVLVDVFGGGAAITHCACLSGKFEKVIYNERDPRVWRAVSDAVHGNISMRWVSHEEFERVKDSDTVAAVCYSYGGNCSDYFTSQINEEWKRLAYTMLTAQTVRDRRLAYLKFVRCVSQLAVKEPDILSRLLHLENLERLERLENLERLERLELSNVDYRLINFPTPDECVVYCDPPYANTTEYRDQFDSETFHVWAFEMAKSYRVYVSEYAMPAPWEPVWTKETLCTKASSNNSKKAIEKLWTIRS